MNTVLEMRGGARIGWVNATGPLAKLSVSAQQLSISGFLLGDYKFSPDQVVALEPHGFIPVLGTGIRIVHTVSNYPQKIVFWCSKSPKQLIEQIISLGFRPSASAELICRNHGMPFRWSFVIILVAIWNGLFFLDESVPWKEPELPGPFSLLALGVLFLTSFALDNSDQFQKWFLKPGRSIDEVRAVVRLVLFISAIMFIILLVFLAVA